jgi:hypothetical protein
MQRLKRSAATIDARKVQTSDGQGSVGGRYTRRSGRGWLSEAPMSVCVNTTRLRQEIARRGWDAIDLAHESRLSPATVSAALAGKPIAAKSVALMADALTRVPANHVIDALVSGDSSERGVA